MTSFLIDIRGLFHEFMDKTCGADTGFYAPGRDHGFASVRPVGTRRLYAIEPAAMDEVEQWLQDLRLFRDTVDGLGRQTFRWPL